MKVLHVIPSVGPLRGGPSEILRTITSSLASAGVKVEVVTTDDNGKGRLNIPFTEAIFEEGVTYRYFPRQSRFYTFSLPLTVWLARHVRDFDLVHIHALFSYVPLAAAYWAKRANVPYIIRPLGVLNRWGMRYRHPWLKKISYRLIERKILNRAAAIHYTSEPERSEAEELGVNQNSVIIPNPVNTNISLEFIRARRGQFRALFPQLSKRLVILFLSRLDPKKGLDILLQSFAPVRARFPAAVLVVAGSGEPAFTARLKQIAAGLGIESDIFWAGFLSGEEKWAALTDADIFVLPSYSENFGVAVVESMACGLPVVISDQVAIHREISKAQAGLVVPCDVEELTIALTTLLQDSELRARTGNNARQLARTAFSAEATRTPLLALYDDILNSAANLIKRAVA